MPRQPILVAPKSEVLARVALRLVQIQYRKPYADELAPVQVVYRALRLLPPEGYTDLRFALHSLAAHLGFGTSSQQWLYGVIERASYGSVFRWHFFALYKATRRPYPPVSNTGVQNEPLPLLEAVEAAQADE